MVHRARAFVKAMASSLTTRSSHLLARHEPIRSDGARDSHSLWACCRDYGSFYPANATERLPDFPRHFLAGLSCRSRGIVGQEPSAVEPAQPPDYGITLFIAVVPVLLLLAMAGLAAYLLYWQLGSYVIYNEMEERMERVGEVAGAMATSYAIEMTSGRRAAALALPEDVGTYLNNAMTELPGLKIETGTGEELLQGATGHRKRIPRAWSFSDGVLSLRAVVARQTLPLEGYCFRICSGHAGADRNAGDGARPHPVRCVAPQG